jgi:hypothetical protein
MTGIDVLLFGLGFRVRRALRVLVAGLLVGLGGRAPPANTAGSSNLP